MRRLPDSRRIGSRIAPGPVVAIVAAYVVAGASLAGLAIAADSAIGGDRMPAALRFGPAAAQALTLTLATAFLVVAAVVFRMRAYALQVTGEGLSSRVMQSLLTDRVQRHSMAFIIGALAYVLVVFRAIPDGGAGLSAVPHLAVGVASLLALLVAGILVFTVHDAARAGRAGGVVRRLSDACIARIRRGHPPAGAGRDRRAAPARASAPGEPVRAADRGWVLTVDERRILAALPPGGTAEVAVRPGQFVVEGLLLGTVWADGRANAAVGVRAAIRLGSDPVLDEDVGYGIRQLVDIAERSLESSASDSTTAREVVLHLGGVLRELLLRDLPPCVVAGDDGRRLLRANEAGFADYVDLAFDRIRISGAHLPEIGVTLLSTIGMLVRELERAGLGERARALQCQAALIVDAAEAATALPHDADRVRRQAEAERLSPPRSQPRAGADLRG